MLLGGTSEMSLEMQNLHLKLTFSSRSKECDCYQGVGGPSKCLIPKYPTENNRFWVLKASLILEGSHHKGLGDSSKWETDAEGRQ